ncbi:hypothetical protein SAMN05216215_104747 [Saccharopolyspora shandongensis]|uniref:Uncharacterized protein n=1 Tax=Saccharopolyspora shandongensis TaxID=418495 RepID=A0A1H3QFT3_9PSEU|nr:hypothetical protein SAMN05216215_104747 [Saccharopolyspora shandongensis]
MACLNGHSETYTETRPNGARVCRKCTNLYRTEQAVYGRNRKGKKNVRTNS